MIHPATRLVAVDSVIGRGVLATAFLPRGTITWVRDALDQTFTEADTEALPECYQDLFDHWTFQDGNRRHVLCWDIGRFMNHSCDANCGGSELGFEVALRDIQPGEELTNDYATMYMRPREQFECLCGAASCRGVISEAATRSGVDVMQDRLRSVLPLLDAVNQPLRFLLPPERLAEAKRRLC